MAPAQHRGCSTHVEQGTQPVPSGCDPVIGVQRDPASVAQWGFLCSMGVQGVSEEVRGHTHPEQTHPPKEKGARRVGPTPRRGRWVLFSPCLGFELLGIRYRRVLRNLQEPSNSL